MMDRRRFARLVAGSLAAGRLSGQRANGARAKTVLYSAVGGELTLYSMDVDEASLVKRNTELTCQYPVRVAASIEAVFLRRLQRRRAGCPEQ